jgi:ferric-dicitrate binding protein FerR (iron transport regulator)
MVKEQPSRINTSGSKSSNEPSDDRCAGCVYGCSGDGSVCISAKAEDIGAPNGPVRITAIQGEELLVSNDGGITWARATTGTLIDYGYMLKTGPNSKMTVQWVEDGSKVFLDPDSTLNMKLLEPKSYGKMDVIIELIKGALFSDVTNREGSKFEVDTTVSVTGVKGTQFSVSYDPITGKSTTKAYEGNVSVKGSSGTIELSPAHMVTTTKAGNGAVTPFDPSEDKTPFSGGICCGSSAMILMSVIIVGSRFGSKK